MMLTATEVHTQIAALRRDAAMHTAKGDHYHRWLAAQMLMRADGLERSLLPLPPPPAAPPPRPAPPPKAKQVRKHTSRKGVPLSPGRGSMPCFPRGRDEQGLTHLHRMILIAVRDGIDDLLELVRHTMRDRSTILRAIKILVEQGLLRAYDGGEGKTTPPQRLTEKGAEMTKGLVP